MGDGIQTPKGFSLFNLATNLVNDVNTSQDKDGLDKVMSFKNTALESAGFMPTVFKGSKMVSKSLPFIGQMSSAYDIKQAYDTIKTERAKPEPNMEVLNTARRNIVTSSMDFISPIGSPGTWLEVGFSGTKFIIDNPQMFTARSPEAISAYQDYTDFSNF